MRMTYADESMEHERRADAILRGSKLPVWDWHGLAWSNVQQPDEEPANLNGTGLLSHPASYSILQHPHFHDLVTC